MSLINRNIKVSNMSEFSLTRLLGVDMVLFKRVKYVNPFVTRFTYFIYTNGELIGTLNIFLDIRKAAHVIILKRFDTQEILKTGILNKTIVNGFFNKEE